MMAKLLHQEFLATRKPLAAIVCWLGLIGLVGLVPVAIPIPFVDQAEFFIAVASFVLLTPSIIAFLVYSYWSTMYGRLGYFTMTIPVSGRLIYWAKVIYMLAVTLAGALVSAVCLVLSSFAMDMGTRQEIGTSMSGLWESITSMYGSAGIPIVFIVVMQLAFLILCLPAVMSISAQSRFNHLGAGAPVIGGILLYVTYQVLALVAMMFLPFGIRLVGPHTGALVARGMWPDIAELVRHHSEQARPEVLGLGMIVTAAVLTVWLVWWGIRSIEHRTSLR